MRSRVTILAYSTSPKKALKTAADPAEASLQRRETRAQVSFKTMPFSEYMQQKKESDWDDRSRLDGDAICLLDDDLSALKGTNRLLLSAGWRAKSFDDPHSFLDYAQMHRPKVAVLDILMPLMNGLEVQRRLGQVSPSTKVIILTSKDDSVVRSKAMEAGASAFFLKPVDSDEFLQAISVTTNGS